MDRHPIESIMTTTMENIRDMVDVNTVIGEPVQASGGATIIPISKVSFGYVTAGGDLTTQEKPKRALEPVDFPFAGGSGAGVSVQPVGFLVVNGESVRMLPATCHNVADRMVELIPTVMEDMKNLLSRGSRSDSARM